MDQLEAISVLLGKQELEALRYLVKSAFLKETALG